jgi:4-hydroxy-2-oxoheptanedioate aldolase
MSALSNNLLEKFRKKTRNYGSLGFFSKTLDSSLVESAGYAGMDFIILDMEHGPASIETIQSHVRAALISGIVPIVRVPGFDGNEISKVLDIGALGVQVPNITSVQHIEQVIEKAKFYPLGSRGVCRFVKAAKFGEEDKGQYFSKANDNLIIIQIEGKKALDSLDDILAVDGYDILFIGPYDLSQSVGVPGQIEHKLVLDLMNTIIEKAHSKNKMIGVFIDTIEQLKKWKKLKLNYYAYSVDIALFVQSLKSTKREFDEN